MKIETLGILRHFGCARKPEVVWEGPGDWEAEAVMRAYLLS